GELGLLGGQAWQGVRRQRLVAQAPGVEQIQSMQEIANRIETLRTKRLLTLEMLAQVDKVRPPQTWLTSATSSDANLYMLMAQGQTKDPAEISVMQDALQNLPQVEPGGVSIKQTRTSNSGSNFNLVVSFRPGSIKASVE
ncbi:MAG: hypothetical protein M3N54_12340, partial [Acidobacteriota bacterium]|nr:hypothetical protein [Acidobacteriota bacterium]